MRLSFLLAQALLCTVVFLGLGSPAKATDFAAICATRDKPAVTEAEKQAIRDQMKRSDVRIDYPPPPPHPWNPPEWERLSIMDGGRTDPRLAGWRFVFVTPCPAEDAEAAMLKYGGFREGLLQILLPPSILQPAEGSAERIVETAISIAQKVIDKGYDFDSINFGIQIVDTPAWDHFQTNFRKSIANNKPYVWTEIERCEQDLVLSATLQPPARCLNFDYLRRMHLANPGKSTMDFIEVYSASNDQFRDKLRADCTRNSLLCKTLQTSVRGQ